MVTVRFMEVRAADVVNLTSPRYLGPVIRSWRGRRDYHDPFYDPLRDAIEETYVRLFNAANGHYERLEADIRKRGVVDPVMLTNGGVHRRTVSELPPQYRNRQEVLISEYLGGSRLMIASRLGLKVPAIVNDFAGTLAGCPELQTEKEIAARFEYPPRLILLNPHQGAYVNDMPYVHMPTGYSMGEQTRIRKAVLASVDRLVTGWLRDND